VALTATVLGAVVLITAIAPLATDIYVPAFPRVGHDLAASATQVQLTLTTFFVGMALGQLIGGPASDRIGRRRPLLAALAVLGAASVVCAFSPSIAVMMTARLVQGFAGGWAMVTARSIVVDLTSARFSAVDHGRGHRAAGRAGRRAHRSADGGDRDRLDRSRRLCPGRAGPAARVPTGPTKPEVTDSHRERNPMRGVVLYGAGDVRVEDRPDPKIEQPTDAVIRLAATCVCGSDLWAYRGIDKLDGPTPMGHEYAGVVEEVGSGVSAVKPGDFVIGSFFASDNTCEICQAGYQTHCIHRQPGAATGAQAECVRVPLADGTLVATPGQPDKDLIPSFLAASDVLGTGWFAAVAAAAGPGKTVAVVGDGAVGLLGVLAAKQLGTERIIAMSRHESRQKLAREFGATDIVSERGDEGVAVIKDLTDGYGAHGVIEAVGTQESMMQAIRSARAGGHVGFVGVSHDIRLPGEELFFSGVHLHGGPAPVRRFLPELIELIWQRSIDPSKVFDLQLPLDDAAEAYRAMDERRAIKSLLTV